MDDKKKEKEEKERRNENISGAKKGGKGHYDDE